MRTVYIILSFLTFLWIGPINGQDNFILSLEPNEAMIGDQVLLKVQIQIPPNAKIEWLDLKLNQAIFQTTPNLQPGISDAPPSSEQPDIEIAHLDKWLAEPDTGSYFIGDWLAWDTLRSGNTQLLVNKLMVIPWDEGVIRLPAVELSYQINGGSRVIRSNDVQLRVGAPLRPQNTTSDSLELAPIKPIRLEARTIADFLPLLLGLLTLGLIGFGVYYFISKRKKPTVVLPTTRRVAVHDWALQKLNALKEKELWQKGEVKSYQSELTFIVREYLENRYKIQALESTTPEILRQLKPLDFSEDHKNEIRQMLQMADMVKFAKAKPEVSVHDQIMDQARKFINRTQVQNMTEESTEGWIEVPIKNKNK